MAMDPYIKRRWVDELRSGRYMQCGGELQNEDGAMCCLGVLDVAATGSCRGGARLPEGSFGLGEDDLQKAMKWNDDHLSPFSQIADRIANGCLDGVPLEGGE